MKATGVIISFLIFNICSQAQFEIYLTDFDTTCSFIRFENMGSWQVGYPNKTIFNTTIFGSKSMITDSVYPYTTNDSSFFVATIYPNNLFAEYNYVYFEIAHKFDTDSLNDFCKIHLTTDGGVSWYNVLSDTLNFIPNRHHFIEQDTNIYGAFPLSGNSFGWVNSKFHKAVWSEYELEPIDSILIKFTFISDSIQTYKDGWQIDKIIIREDHVGNIFETKRLNEFAKVFPNPMKRYLSIEFPNPSNETFNFNIYNINGEKVYQVSEFTGKSIILNDLELESGLYFYTLDSRSRLMGSGKLLQE